jgi:hypothetical protein
MALAALALAALVAVPGVPLRQENTTAQCLLTAYEVMPAAGLLGCE